MSLRARLTLVAAAAVALAVVVASIAVYFVVRGQLRGQVDDSLRHRAVALTRFPELGVRIEDGYLRIPGPPFGTTAQYSQAVPVTGPPVLTPPSPFSPAPKPLPVSGAAREAAAGHGDAFFSDVSAFGIDFRVLTIPGHRGYALQLARPLTEVNHTLHRIAIFLIIIAAAGIAAAAALGLLVSRAALTPVRRMTRATETVTETGDLSERIDTRGRDELSRLAASFNQMLGALEESRMVQRRLVEDASHELRTPLTSLRTNIEVLAGERELPPDERRRLLADVVEQLGEMTTIVAELIELARGEQPPDRPEDVRLDLVAAEAVERARRNTPAVVFETDLQPSTVYGVRPTIERAVGNLLDNAAKWSPPEGPVEVTVRDGVVTVRDHGPGIDDDDLPHVFDRFYRAPSARGMPGSGLGLSIVRQVAEAHGGTATAERASGGGTLVTLRLNGIPDGNGDTRFLGSS